MKKKIGFGKGWCATLRWPSSAFSFFQESSGVAVKKSSGEAEACYIM